MLGDAYFGKQDYTVALEFFVKANDHEPEKEDIELL